MLGHFVCLRTREWKYVLYDDGSEELFDLQADPGECRNMLPETLGSGLHETAKRKLAKRIGERWAGHKPGWWDPLIALVPQDSQEVTDTPVG